MTPSYYNTPPSILSRLIAGLPSGLAVQMQRLWDRQTYSSVSTSQPKLPRSLRQVRHWNLRRTLSLPHILIALWAVLLLWGEKWVFESSIKACTWDRWEKWVRGRRGWGIGNEANDANSPRVQHLTIWCL